MAIGLDKDCVEGRVYWGDISTKKILSVKYDGTDEREFITTGKSLTRLGTVTTFILMPFVLTLQTLNRLRALPLMLSRDAFTGQTQ